jgi:hypothetical protein
MTAFRPCFGCVARNDCEIKKGAVKALRGIPITLAKIKCDLPWTEHFPPGTRALVKAWDHREMTTDRWGDPCAVERMVPATVVGKSTKKPGKLLLHLDTPVQSASETEIKFRAAWPKEIQKLDEPRAPFCSRCSRAYVNDRCNCYDEYGYAEAS